MSLPKALFMLAKEDPQFCKRLYEIFEGWLNKNDVDEIKVLTDTPNSDKVVSYKT